MMDSLTLDILEARDKDDESIDYDGSRTHRSANCTSPMGRKWLRFIRGLCQANKLMWLPFLHQSKSFWIIICSSIKVIEDNNIKKRRDHMQL